MGTPGESEDAVLLAVEEARRRDVTVGTAVTYVRRARICATTLSA